jgi:hypothetical protein
VVLLRRSKRLTWPAAARFGALSAALLVAVPCPASAGIFDFLFGGPQQQAPLPPPVSSYAEPAAPPISAAPVNPYGGGSGRFVAFCVRLCDGQHFPFDRMANATPVETCRSMCPASKTKVFFGGEIDHAVARDGASYANLDNAFVYRQRLVANCTCNGKDAFGLAPFDLASDPTLRPGDIVATKNGFMAFTGKRGKTDRFTTVNSSTLTAELNAGFSRVRLARRSTEPPIADEEPGIIVPRPADMHTAVRDQAVR